MKKITTLLFLFVLAPTLTFCDSQELEELLAFDITEDITQNYPIAVAQNGDCSSFLYDATLDLKSNTDIAENFSNVTSVTINALSWEVMNYVGDEGVFMNNATLKIGDTSFNINGEVDLKSSDIANEKFIFSDTVKLNAVSEQLLTTGAVLINLSSSTSGNCENDFSFTLSLTANVKVTVSP